VLTDIVHRIVSNPRIYDGVQRLAGRDRNFERLSPHLADASGKTLLDIGGGTGECARIAPASATYIWLDNDPEKLSGFRAKFAHEWALLGEANQIGLKDKSVDIAVCMAVSHHLTDHQLSCALREVARVCRQKLIFLDAIRQETSTVSNLLWKYDRGSHPRTAGALRSSIAQYFSIEHEELYSIYHHYWLCTAKPKDTAPWR
jgi:ubiquinone/menaquinone biosynthesis C-methylase UbiE